MKVSLYFANKYSNVDLIKSGVDQLINKVGSQLGAIEDIEDWGQKYNKACVVKVVECQKHPNADKLSVCLIDDGNAVNNVSRNEKGLIQVVCGAPNVVKGVLAVWLPPGAIIPATASTDQPFALSKKEIRGIESNGMLAAPDELGLGEDHDGLLLLDNGQPGENFAKVFGLDDTVLDLENKMFTHRPDCFGVLGVARELAGIQNFKFTSPDWYINKPVFEKIPKEDLPTSIDVKTDLVPRFMAVAIKNVTIKPSSPNIKTALLLSGIKPINNIVDITNYLSQLTGQPMHAYDYDKLAAKSQSKTANLTARPAHIGEELVLLGGKQIKLQDEATIMIASGNEPVGIGGVMGGADTEVDANTKNIVLECANFDMYAVRKTAMRYGLFTDAVTRFTKGQSPLQNDRVLAKAMLLVKDEAGGVQASNIYDYVSNNLEVVDFKETEVSISAINKLLGRQFKDHEIAGLLKNVEISSHKVSDDILSLRIPFWRTDIAINNQANGDKQVASVANADIAEEVGRLFGFDKLPVNLPLRQMSATTKNPTLEFKKILRRILAAAGANEILTYNFVAKDSLNKVGQNSNDAFELSNALSPSLQYYRLSLLPNVLEKVHPNIKAGFSDFAIFEIGKCHNKNNFDNSGLPEEQERLALVIAADYKKAQQYIGSAFYRAKIYLEEILRELNIEAQYKPLTQDHLKMPTAKVFYAPRSAAVYNNDGEFIGFVGEFNKMTLTNLKIGEFTAGFEIDMLRLKAAADNTSPYQPLPKFPKAEQDITLKIEDNSITYEKIYTQLINELTKLKPTAATLKLSPVDIYQKVAGQPKHFTFRLEITSFERTMKASEVNNLLDKAAENLRPAIKAVRI